jgi:hypothetical protein
MTEPTFELKRSGGPSVTYLIIGCLMQSGLIYLFLRGDFAATDVLLCSIVVWLFVGFHVASFWLYKARLIHGVIGVRPFGTFKWKSLPISAIDRVQVKRLSPDFSRGDRQLPTSRLEFEGRGRELVAMSLKHFERDDLRRLLSAVGQARPDLDLPSI